MLGGVGLFGVLSGYVASLLLGNQSEEKNPELREALERLQRIESKLEQVAIDDKRRTEHIGK
jgi:hypothetical protein